MTPIKHEVLREDVYGHLIQNEIIDCDFDTFKKEAEVYKTPHGVYMDIDKKTLESKMNKILNVTTEDLYGYKNLVDYWVRQYGFVRYIKEFDAYVLFNEAIIQ